MPILPIQETPCQALIGTRHRAPAPAVRPGLGAVSIPGIGVIDIKWLLIAAVVLAVFVVVRSRKTSRRRQAKRIIRRVTEY